MNFQPGVGYTVNQTGGAVSLTIEQPWGFWTKPHPFTVSCFKDGSDFKVRVIPGTINNIEPQMSGDQLSAVPAPTMNIGYSASPATEYIYLLMPADTSTSPATWPDGPTVIHDSAPQTSTDAQAYLLLATVDISTGVVSQSVSGSQWGERYKCGANDAVYFFGMV